MESQENAENSNRIRFLESTFSQRAGDTQKLLAEIRSEDLFEDVPFKSLVDQRANVKNMFDESNKLLTEYIHLGGFSSKDYDRYISCFQAVYRILSGRIKVRENATIKKINSELVGDDGRLEEFLNPESDG